MNKMSFAATEFAGALQSGQILVKSISTGEVKSIDAKDTVKVYHDCMLSNFEVRDNRIVPKQNYTKADPSMVNIYAHKGPDENNSNGGIAL